MTYEWKEAFPERPDRYLDWQLQKAKWGGGPAKDCWCSVLVQVRQGPPEDRQANLRKLKDDIGGSSAKMHKDEALHLDRVIKAISNGDYVPVGDEDVGLEFFIYLPEHEAYSQGVYAHREHYSIRYVGPPMGAFDPAKVAGEATRFQTLAVADATGVAIGIIDDSIAFAHERFRTGRGEHAELTERTRIAAIWLQEMEAPTSPLGEGVAFGRRLQADDIDKELSKSASVTGAISDAEVYRQTGVLDFFNESAAAKATRIGHGTHVMDLACGFDPSDPIGRQRPILAVQLPYQITADTSGVSMVSYVLQALRQIMLWADRLNNDRPLPLVVNFSYGIAAGPKDGSQFLEQEIDRLVSHRNRKTRTAVVLPSGNSYLDQTTALMTLPGHASQTLDWIILPDDATPSYLEIWFDPASADSDNSPIALTLEPPLGLQGPAKMPRQGESRILTNSGQPICGVYYDVCERHSGHDRGRIFLATSATKSLDPGVMAAPCGPWRISITNTSSATLNLQLFIQRDDTPAGYRQRGRQSHFEHVHAHERDPTTGNYDFLESKLKPCPITHAATLSAIGTGLYTVLVGAAKDGDTIEPADYTSSGPTISKSGPDFSVIADDGQAHPGILAAGTMSGSVVALRGTSVAAPQVTRKLVEANVQINVLKQLGIEQDSLRLGRLLATEPRSDIPRRLHPRRSGRAFAPQAGSEP